MFSLNSASNAPVVDQRSRSHPRGTAAFDTSTENYVEVAFEEGAIQALICFTASTEHSGSPHFAQGMVTQFEVTG